MELNLVNEQGQETAKVPASDAVFARQYNEALVHQLVVAYMANARQGTRAQLNREFVHHTTKKPFRQKGTGRARAGMSSSPLWRGGGRTFPSTPNESFSKKMNKKAYRAAMATIFSKLVADGRLVVVESIGAETPKTKAFAAKLKAMGLTSAMLIAETVDDNLFLASRNIKNVTVVEPRYIDPLSLIHYEKIVVAKGALSKIEEMLG
ncbi:MAG: 50S ribosomal protein L4 [Sutterella sp.]|nr:50S ribosomal protein L4 [Sutterella sp.]MDD7426996.1 50S ribosomal protein L4 [Sutterella sp.]